MRRALLMLLVVLGGCFNPDDIFPIRGSITSTGAIAGQRVRLLRGSADFAADAFCQPDQPFKETVTDEAGAFTFEVFRAQSQKLAGHGQFCFRVETTFPSGTQVFSEMQFLGAETRLQPFPDWRARPFLDGGVLDFQPFALPPPGDGGPSPEVHHRAEWITGDGGLAWVAGDGQFSFDGGAAERAPIVLDELALEDFAGRLSLRAQAFELREGFNLGDSSAPPVEALSGDTLDLVGHRQPISRGLPCPPAGMPCPLTDGDLTPVELNTVRSFTIALLAPSPLSGVVLRGVEASVPVVDIALYGADGGLVQSVEHFLPPPLWSEVVRPRPRRDGGSSLSFGGMWAVVPLDAGVPIGSVRVAFPGGVEALSEVSVFDVP